MVFPSFRQLLPLALWGSAVAFCPPLPRLVAAERPNVVVFMLDDAGYDDFGFMQSITGVPTQFKTPRLDQLAAQSVVFSNAYVTGPVCSVSRAGLLTGTSGSRFGMEYQIADFGTDPRDGAPVTQQFLSQSLKTLGYRTGTVGKWHLGRAAENLPLGRGFDEYFGFLSGGVNYFGFDSTEQNGVLRNTTLVDWTTEASFLGTPPDPVSGRYLTDAFGDEGAKFIADHANEADPFFLYMPLSAPHGPFQAKRQDTTALNSTTLTGQIKTIAAQALAADRAIGNVLDRLDDPNGDGNTSDSVADSTIVVFVNDNGGTATHGNGNLRGLKGSAWEGGIRIPILIRAPGMTPRQVDQMVSTADVLPTVIAAAGGSVPAGLDGVNLLPTLQSNTGAAVHSKLFWRGGINYWAVRKGDWKFVKGDSASLPQLHQLQLNGTGETVDLTNSQFEKYLDLQQEFVDWEVTLPRPSQTLDVTFNLFDRFLYNAPSGTGEWGWRSANIWLNADNPSQIATLRREDSYANLTLIFHPYDHSSFNTRNNISRAAGMAYTLVDNPAVEIPDGFREVVLNQLRFEGSYDGTIARQGNLRGLPLMFTKNLAGGLPQLHLGSQRSTNQSYTFNIDFDLVLHDDLEITGNSVLTYQINGDIREFSSARSLSKQGTSNVTLAGRVALRGNVSVSQGALRIDGDDAALVGPASIAIGAQGKLSLIRGTIDAQQIVQNGGPLEFLGGNLTAAGIQGDLNNQGGTLNVRTDAAGTTLAGAYRQNNGSTLHMEISAGNPGFLDVTGAFEAGGVLDIDLASDRAVGVNDRFQLMEAASFSGTFSSIQLPTNLPSDLFWDSSRLTSQGLLSVWSYADVNADNFIDALDFAIISQNYGNLVAARTLGDVDGNARVDASDFLAWQSSAFAQRVVSAVSSFVAVPEPGGMCLAAACAASACRRPRRRPDASASRR